MVLVLYTKGNACCSKSTGFIFSGDFVYLEIFHSAGLMNSPEILFKAEFASCTDEIVLYVVAGKCYGFCDTSDDSAFLPSTTTSIRYEDPVVVQYLLSF